MSHVRPSRKDYLDWPHLAQVVMVARKWWDGGKRHEAVRDALTRLPPQVADAARLLTLARDRVPRGQVQIENGVHYANGHPLGRMTLGEDRSTIRVGHGPSVMEMLRDTVVSMLHRPGWRTIAERLRFYSGNVDAALALLGIPRTENA
jgi:hypothetical protein